jgi:hypothetical protein
VHIDRGTFLSSNLSEERSFELDSKDELAEFLNSGTPDSETMAHLFFKPDLVYFSKDYFGSKAVVDASSSADKTSPTTSDATLFQKEKIAVEDMISVIVGTCSNSAMYKEYGYPIVMGKPSLK